ncbi:catechol 2,3-dioxygenase-like lactoylglutathione lyase family enzyme [Allocatelliglobosispora scoriae]|uniref:Catechol 2,3-dioxygenase-like lactoylglutathione lyase family enzyme n=1 Tax=Allocatelliglobosispora scoriae TaxID=643052 RepID=A0A841BQZ5_9ACTN|nr:VOC family protein [Allocatelliglobosispora scoriae]MBB5869808.1 catechol 2,3-dioxygenase-like lactoylglutathione lyase family enzyme [Allocatelliglobosispora scoriae]
MANGLRKPLGTGRVTLAIILGTLGAYTAAAGAGMTSWPLAAIGVAALVLGVSLVVTSTMRGADRAWVDGTGYVLEIHEAPQSLTHGRCEMMLQIDAPGHPAASVKIRDPRVPVAKWPAVGSILPIQVATDDIRRVRVLWDEVRLVDSPTQQQPSQPSQQRQQPPPPQPQRSRYVDEADIYAGVTGDETYRPTTRREADYVFDIDADPETPPPTRRPGPGPRPRRTPEAEPETPPTPEGSLMTEVADEGPRGYTVDESGLIEGDLLVVPASIDVIDFNDAHPGPAADKPPSARENVVELVVGVPGQRQVEDVEPGYIDDGLISPLGGTIHGVGITMLVVDVSRSVAFYRDLLGFYEIDSGHNSAVLASGDTRIVLRRADELGTTNRRLTHLNLEVGDLDAVYRDLRRKGVEFTYAPRVVNRGERLELWGAAFKDPDGHAVNLTQWRARS